MRWGSGELCRWSVASRTHQTGQPRLQTRPCGAVAQAFLRGSNTQAPPTQTPAAMACAGHLQGCAGPPTANSFVNTAAPCPPGGKKGRRRCQYVGASTIHARTVAEKAHVGRCGSIDRGAGDECCESHTAKLCARCSGRLRRRSLSNRVPTHCGIIQLLRIESGVGPHLPLHLRSTLPIVCVCQGYATGPSAGKENSDGVGGYVLSVG